MKKLSKLSLASALAFCVPLISNAADDLALLTPTCEEALALSALPARLRAGASVYALTGSGFKKTRSGEGPFTCIIERNHHTALIPQCVDAAGADTIIPGIIKKSEWALAGIPREERKAQFDELAKKGKLSPPARPGISYMMSAFNFAYTGDGQDMQHIPPHVMFYAPNIGNDDVGGSMQEAMNNNRGTPFIIEEGIHGYMTSFVEQASDSSGVAAACGDQIRVVTQQATASPKSAARIDAAIAATIRSERDHTMDASRKPREFLEFLGLSEGDVVAEINAGSGYNARLLPTIVGDSGQVYATNAEFVLTLFEGINERLSASVRDVPNIHVSTQANDRVVLPTTVDVAILNNIYHDLHGQKVDTYAFNRSVYAALRPGGHYVVGDHHAVAGSGIDYVESIHRIDRDLVVREIEAAGFELVATADFLANPADDRQVHVIDAAIRGKTDRFLLKFQRPE